VIRLEFIYVLMGLLTGGVALVNALDPSNPRRINNAAFWGIYSVTFLAGSYLPDFVSGCLVLAMVACVAVKGLGQGDAGRGTRDVGRGTRDLGRWPDLIFVPALLVPAVTLVGTLTLKNAHLFGRAIVDPKQVTQISLGIATLVALAAGFVLLRPPALAPVREARRLLDSVGWAAVLPQSLAALGAIFSLAGVGTVVAGLAQRWIPLDHAIVAVATYTIGMALFTMVMGNAFAAFPVMTAGIGLPVIVGQFGGNVVIMSAIGMLSGFCGTLMTPMAANFNIVPTALLELPDQNAVIKVQIPTAIPLLLANTLIMYFTVFRH
jgi:uncharacterized membrane protein